MTVMSVFSSHFCFRHYIKVSIKRKNILLTLTIFCSPYILSYIVFSYEWDLTSNIYMNYCFFIVTLDSLFCFCCCCCCYKKGSKEQRNSVNRAVVVQHICCGHFIDLLTMRKWCVMLQMYCTVSGRIVCRNSIQCLQLKTFFFIVKINLVNKFIKLKLYADAGTLRWHYAV